MALNLKYLIEYCFTALTARNLKTVVRVFWSRVLFKLNFISKFYTRNENMWQDGFLLDFLQKKTADAWVRRFVIYTGFLFSERLVFDSIVRIYLDNLIWPGHRGSMFEMANVSEVLISTIFLITTLWFLLVLCYTFVLF